MMLSLKLRKKGKDQSSCLGLDNDFLNMTPRAKKQKKKKEVNWTTSKFKSFRVPIVAQWLMNPTRNHEVAGLISGLTQWVKNPALP